MSRLRWSPERLAQALGLYRSMTNAAAAKKMGITISQFENAVRRHAADPPPPEVKHPSPSGLPVGELVEDRIRRFRRKAAHEESRKLIPVTIREDKPIGILHFGDPHLDDDGTDLAVVRAHGELVRKTPGLYGANVGDTTNNWIGRLSALYGSQTTTESEAWQLATWFIRDTVGPKWLYIVGGNHDAWSGTGDPLKWIAGEAKALYQDSEVRVALRFPNKREVRINCRHDFAGRSMYNPAHGPMKALFFGVRDHVAIAGHVHESAYGVLKDPDTGITMHAVKVASYKTFDRYAREKGFRDQTLSPCALTVIDPRLEPTHPDLVKVFWDPMEGASYLTWLRARKAA